MLIIWQGFKQALGGVFLFNPSNIGGKIYEVKKVNESNFPELGTHCIQG